MGTTHSPNMDMNPVSGSGGSNSVTRRNIESTRITVTRMVKVRRNGGISDCNMSIGLPRDVVELVGWQVGDHILVTGDADGWIKIVRADSVASRGGDSIVNERIRAL